MHLLLVDIYSVIEKVWCELKAKGRVENEGQAFVDGVCSSLNLAVDYIEPSHMAVIWSGIGSSDRRKKNPLYAIDRFELPLHAIPYLRNLCVSLSEMGIAAINSDGKESYDVMAVISEKLSDHHVTYMTPDDRCWSFVTENHTVRWPWAPEAIRQEITPTVFASIFEEQGINPGHYLGYLFLMRLKGIGPAQASAIIKKHTDLKSVAENMDEIGGRAGKSIRASIKTQGRQIYHDIFPMKIKSLGISISQLALGQDRLAA
jgi:DNA polymerase-1